jgi:hypothetical protein
VLGLFLDLPAAAAGLQGRLSGLPDADRLLPKAAAAVRELLLQQQRVKEAQQQADVTGECQWPLEGQGVGGRGGAPAAATCEGGTAAGRCGW